MTASQMYPFSGAGSPTRRGIGEAAGAPAGDRRRSSEYGVTLYAIFVSVCSAARSGTGRTDSVPVSIDPMYCAFPPGNVRMKKRGFAPEVSPFPLRTNTREPSPLIIDAVGYQPVGMNPSTSLEPGFATFTTATVLLSAFATSSRV